MAPIQPFSPILQFTPYSLTGVVEDVRARLFPQVGGPLPVFVVDAPALAWCVTSSFGGGVRGVYFHPLLNHPATPIEVIDNVARHELLHLARTTPRDSFYPGRHSPEFWAQERRLAPDMPLVTEWMLHNFGEAILRTPVDFSITRRWRTFELTQRSPYPVTNPREGESLSPPSSHMGEHLEALVA